MCEKKERLKKTRFKPFAGVFVFLAAMVGLTQGDTVCYETQRVGGLNGDHIVNFKDFATMASQWLESTTLGNQFAIVLPTFIVASSDASPADKQIADYVCDGIEDDVEIQAAIDLAATCKGTVVLTRGTFHTAKSIHMPDYVTLQGSGMYATFIKGTASNWQALILRSSTIWTPVALRTSRWNPAKGIVIRDLTVSGENTLARSKTGGQTYTYDNPPAPSANNWGAKGIFMNYLEDCRFENLRAYRTTATGIGNDSHRRCYYINCRAEQCGWAKEVYGPPSLWAGAYVGKYGFGIGYGGIENESVTLTNCYAEGNSHGGFGFESTDVGYQTQNLVMQNCVSAANDVGFKIWDMATGNMFGATLIDCTALNNTNDGVYILTKNQGVRIVGGLYQGNGRHGIAIGDSLQEESEWGSSSPGYNYRYDQPYNTVVDRAIVRNNSKCGIWVYAQNAQILSCDISYNYSHGIRAYSYYADVTNLKINNNNIWNNGIGGSQNKDGIYLQSQTYHDVTDALIVGNSIYDMGGSAKSISTISRSDNVVTVTYYGSHGLVTGDTVDVAGVSDSSYNANNVTVTVTALGSFTYTSPGSNSSSSGGTFTRKASQRYGVHLHSPNVSRYIKNVLIENNYLGVVNQMNGYYATNSSYQKDVVVRNNTGYKTENSGFSIGTGSQQAIAHGLSARPTIVTISGVSGNVNWYQSAAPDETNIYITVDNGVDYYWSAMLR